MQNSTKTKKIYTFFTDKNIKLSIILFIVSYFISLWFFNGISKPVYYFDTYSYYEVVKSICSLDFPNLSFRTLGYPLFLVLSGACKTDSFIIYLQFLLGSLSIVILFYILQRVINKTIAFIISLIMALDIVGVGGYHITILTESLTLFLVMLFVYSHIRLIEEKFKKKEILIVLIVDIFLILTKPTFFILPIFIYIFFIFVIIIQKEFKCFLKIFMFLILINCFFILSLCLLNLKQGGDFSLSTVATYNTLGKVIEYKFFEKEYTNPPQLFYDAKESVIQPWNYGNPWWVMADITGIPLKPENLNKILAEPVVNINSVKDLNSYLINQNKKEYIVKTIKKIPMVIETQRSYYGVSYSDNYIKSDVMTFINNFFNSTLVLRTQILVILLAYIIYMYFLKKQKIFINHIIILTTIFYTVSIIAVGSYAEESRLRMPIEMFINSMIIYFFYLCYIYTEYLINDYKQIKIYK